MKGIALLFDREPPAALVANLAQRRWFASAAFPSPLVLAGRGGGRVVIVTRWLSLSWKRATWIALGIVAAARLISGTVLPMEFVLAFAVGADRWYWAARWPSARRIFARARRGRRGACRPEVSLSCSALARTVHGKGSRPFVVTNAEGERFFVKVLGQDQRDADLLYRVYRSIRLRDVGDVRPAASLKQSVEHQALVGLMAERAECACAAGPTRSLRDPTTR